jgi:ubiquitin-conjugating enzyme E2 O
MMRPLMRGEVGVSFFPTGVRDILPESDFTLVDRTFQRGDYCKRAVDDVQSGVVTSINVEGGLEHSISREPVEGWHTMDELEIPVDVDIADYVVYDDWIGQACNSRPSSSNLHV